MLDGLRGHQENTSLWGDRFCHRHPTYYQRADNYDGRALRKELQRLDRLYKQSLKEPSSFVITRQVIRERREAEKLAYQEERERRFTARWGNP